MTEKKFTPKQHEMLDAGWVFTLVFFLLLRYSFPNAYPYLIIVIGFAPMMLFMLFLPGDGIDNADAGKAD